MISDLSLAHANNGEVKESKEGDWGNHLEPLGTERPPKACKLQPVPLFMMTKSFVKAWAEWIEYRTAAGIKRRWSNDPMCFNKSLNKCKQWGPERAAVAIDFSIEMGYRGLFEPRRRAELKPKPARGTVHTGVQGRIF